MVSFPLRLVCAGGSVLPSLFAKLSQRSQATPWPALPSFTQQNCFLYLWSGHISPHFVHNKPPLNPNSQFPEGGSVSNACTLLGRTCPNYPRASWLCLASQKPGCFMAPTAKSPCTLHLDLCHRRSLPLPHPCEAIPSRNSQKTC